MTHLLALGLKIFHQEQKRSICHLSHSLPSSVRFRLFDLSLDLEELHGIAALDESSIFFTQVADAFDQLDWVVFTHVKRVIGS